MDFIAPLHHFEPFSFPPGALAGAPERQQEEEDGERNGAPAERRPCSWPAEQPGGECGDHRRPAFQSSQRAEIATAMPASAAG